jgi:hypothetical protein
MQMRSYSTLTLVGAAGALIGSTALLTAGEPAPYVAPEPTSSCDACNDPGWYASATALYLKSYANGVSDLEAGGYDGDWDFGARGALGFERPDGLFFELSGFWYDGEGDFDDVDSVGADIEAWYIDFLVGDNLHCGEACLDYAFGIRYADSELEVSDDFESVTEEFDGFGPVLQLRGSRPLSGNFGIYAQFTQAILFGESDFSVDFGEGERESGDSDTIASITELEGGLQYNFDGGALSDAYIRLGLEGQYWVGDSVDTGLFGGILEFGIGF